jgi:sulfoxide reductase heme-binding subunit YedZ
LSSTRNYHFPQWILHAAALLPGIILAFYTLFGHPINPIQTLERRSGDIALVLLLTSLACTPLRILTRQSLFSRLRRPLGLYAFAYAALHFLLFIGLDYGFQLKEAIRQLIQNVYLWAGLAALLILLALALTSTKRSQMVLKKNWLRLHRLVYLAGLLVVLHFGLSVKGSFFQLRGQIQWPLIALIVLLVLLAIRLPIFRRRFSSKK